MRYQKNDGGRSIYFNGQNADDCVIRSISIALSQDYLETFNDLFDLARSMGYLPNSQKVFEKYLKTKGWVKNKTLYKPDSRRRYEINEWRLLSGDRALPHRCLIKTSGHLTAVVDGVLRDSWDCSEWCAGVYYTPSQQWYENQKQKRKVIFPTRKKEAA